MVYNTPGQWLFTHCFTSQSPLVTNLVITCSPPRACCLDACHSRYLPIHSIYSVKPPVMSHQQGESRTPPTVPIVKRPEDVLPNTGLRPCLHNASVEHSTANEIQSVILRIPASMTSSTGLPVVVRSQGHYFQLRDGRQVLDACGGAGVTCIGHGNLEVLSAMNTEASNLTYIPWAFFDNQSTIDLQDWLIQSTGRKMTKVYLQSSGT